MEGERGTRLHSAKVSVECDGMQYDGWLILESEKPELERGFCGSVDIVTTSFYAHHLEQIVKALLNRKIEAALESAKENDCLDEPIRITL